MGQLKAGEIFEKRYQVVKQLGVGGMGSVYRAKQIDAANRDVAIKLISSTELEDPELAKRMLRESKILSQLEHKNIMTIFGINLDETNIPYMITEFIRGRSLRQVIDQEGPLPWQRASKLVIQACSGMSAAHKLGIIHRDLKPENLMLLESKSEEDYLKIIDFGLSFSHEARMAESQRLTRTGSLVGTCHYMSPEQITGQAQEQSDLYALGCILFELLSGEKLFDAENSVGVLYLQSHEEAWKRFSAIKQAIPTSLFKLLQNVLEKDPEARPQNAANFANELQEIISASNECVTGQQYLKSSPKFANTLPSKLPLKRRWKIDYRIASLILIPLMLFIAVSFSLQTTKRQAGPKRPAAQKVDDEKLAPILNRTLDYSGREVFDHQAYKLTKGAKYNKYGYIWLRSAAYLTRYLHYLPMPYSTIKLAQESEDIVSKKGLPSAFTPDGRPLNVDPLRDFWDIRLAKIGSMKNLDSSMSIGNMMSMLDDKTVGLAPDWCFSSVLTSALLNTTDRDLQDIIASFNTGADSNEALERVTWALLQRNKFPEVDKILSRKMVAERNSPQLEILRAQIDVGLGKREEARRTLRALIRTGILEKFGSYSISEAMLDAGMLNEVISLPDYASVLGQKPSQRTNERGFKEQLEKMLALANEIHSSFYRDMGDYLGSTERMEIHSPENVKGAQLLEAILRAIQITKDPVQRCRLICFFNDHASDWRGQVMQSYAFQLCKNKAKIMPRELRLRCSIEYGELTSMFSQRNKEALTVLQEALNDIEKNGYPEHTDYGSRIDAVSAARARLAIFVIHCRLNDKASARKVLEEMVSKNQAHYVLDGLLLADKDLAGSYFQSEIKKVDNDKMFFRICTECMRIGRRDVALKTVRAWESWLQANGISANSDRFAVNRTMAALVYLEYNDYLQAKTILLQFKGDKDLSGATKRRLDFAREIVLNH